MATKFTAGPWRVEEGTTLVWGDCLPDDHSSYGMGYPVAEARVVLGRYGHKSHREDEADANARLIAAAPELFEALLRLVEHHGDVIYEDKETGASHLKEAHAALRAARGEQGDG